MRIGQLVIICDMKFRFAGMVAFMLGNAVAMAVEPVVLADPTVLVDGKTYYLYGTSGVDSNLGFPYCKSENLSDWKDSYRLALARIDGNIFGTKWFWAPQVFKHDGKYYMFYTANERIAYAMADSPAGPFTGGGEIVSDINQIDPFVFFDDDGSAILYHVRLDRGNRIYAVRLSPDLSRMQGKPVECISAVLPWENTASSEWGVTEGPTVIKRGDEYVMFYSANDFRNPDYAVGIATASSPFGPWHKRPAPIIHRSNIGRNGTGHGDLFTDKDGNLCYVFHVHNTDEEVSPRRTMIVNLDKETLTPIVETLRELTIN